MLLIFYTIIFLFSGPIFSFSKQEEKSSREKASLIKILGIIPSDESVDYVLNKTQFQLHTLVTEQRHPKTLNLSRRIHKDYSDGLDMLFSVDEDIVKKLNSLVKNTKNLYQAVDAIEEALLSKNKIYIYGCGATGRLAKQMESAFWRPFWKKVKQNEKIWAKIKTYVASPIEDQLIGEMTGGDRALISSLEGFEDLQLIGNLQLKDRGIQRGDVVICVTEGGETSSVIGTIMAALNQWKEASSFEPKISRKKLYFVYNNPDDKLLPFDRSRKVLEEKGITKINLTTGPQAITGSTRMQATTIETFVIGNILQTTLDKFLRKFLTDREMEKLGFTKKHLLEETLTEFESILEEIKKSVSEISKFTQLETNTYKQNKFSTYFASEGLITVFIDSTERSPTFRLYPLDTIKDKKRESWIQVWTAADDLKEAWKAFLGRKFRGLPSKFYKKPFEKEITDPYLKKAALQSLKDAGDNQQFLYDFSFSKHNIKNRGPKEGDLGVVVCLSPEEDYLKKNNSNFRKFINLFTENNAHIALILISEKQPKKLYRIVNKIKGLHFKAEDSLVNINIERKNDPFGLKQQIALKILLNAHSTAVMTRLGKVIGNTMTNVSPSNLKLIGRATFLIQEHINDVIRHPNWVEKYGVKKPISYGEANAVLFEAIKFLKTKKTTQTAEVALSITHVLESLKQSKRISQKEAYEIVNNKGLAQFLHEATSNND